MSDAQDENPASPNEILVTYHGEVGSIPIFPVNGAYGGVDPMGETIVANLYFEQTTVPVAGFLDRNEDGAVNPASERFQKRSDIQRRMVCTINLSSESARRLANWLILNADTIDKIRKSRGE
jgi:hypothetical protein